MIDKIVFFFVCCLFLSCSSNKIDNNVVTDTLTTVSGIYKSVEYKNAYDALVKEETFIYDTLTKNWLVEGRIENKYTEFDKIDYQIFYFRDISIGQLAALEKDSFEYDSNQKRIFSVHMVTFGDTLNWVKVSKYQYLPDSIKPIKTFSWDQELLDWQENNY